MIDFTPLYKREKSLDELTRGLSPAELHTLTDEMIDTMLDLLSQATDADVVFLPDDPEAFDENAENPDDANLAWTLGHVIVHATATAEEAAAMAANLARGVPLETRMRAETPWMTVSTVQQLRARLEESRRMRHAFLNAWPDRPNLTLTYKPDHPKAKPRNAVTRFVAGLLHDDNHLAQIRSIIAQASAARAGVEVPLRPN
jgi:hypothetical protein